VQCAEADDGPVLNSLIEQLLAERADDQVAAWRRLEARLGYDPDEAPEGLIDALSAFEGRVGSDGIEEAAVATPGEAAPAALEAAIEASKASAIVVDLDFARNVGLGEEAGLPWMLAEQAAGKVREVAGMRAGAIRGQALADLVSAQWQSLRDAPATARSLSYAARLKDGRDEHLALQTANPRDRRFEVARMIGDAVWSGAATFGVVSRAKTDRQKFQRAFAQSLLCPFAELRDHVDLAGPTEEQMTAAAKYFHVNPSVVRTLLVNKGILPRETLEERLEAA